MTKGQRLLVQACRFARQRGQGARVDRASSRRRRAQRRRPVAGRRRRHARPRGQGPPPGPRPRPDRARRRRLDRGRALRRPRTRRAARGQVHATRSGSPTSPPARRGPTAAPTARYAARVAQPAARAAERPHDATATWPTTSSSSSSSRCSYPTLVKPLTLPHKTAPRAATSIGIEIATDPVQPRRRQAHLPEHGRPPRARVAVVRARDGVGVRPARPTTASSAGRRGSSRPRATS